MPLLIAFSSFPDINTTLKIVITITWSFTLRCVIATTSLWCYKKLSYNDVISISIRNRSICNRCCHNIPCPLGFKCLFGKIEISIYCSCIIPEFFWFLPTWTRNNVSTFSWCDSALVPSVTKKLRKQWLYSRIFIHGIFMKTVEYLFIEYSRSSYWLVKE